MSITDHRMLAQQDQALTRGRLGWQRLQRNLLLNNLATQREVEQLQVHFRFLGAFVHPTSERAERLVYSNHIPYQVGLYDHSASELVLLYAINLCADALLSFAECSTREPSFELRGWPSVSDMINEARSSTAHFWWPGAAPHNFDRVQEANHRGLPDTRESGLELVPREERLPDQIPETEIRYYRNPLERLRRMHEPSYELTGFPYEPPWPVRRRNRGYHF